MCVQKTVLCASWGSGHELAYVTAKLWRELKRDIAAVASEITAGNSRKVQARDRHELGSRLRKDILKRLDAMRRDGLD